MAQMGAGTLMGKGKWEGTVRAAFFFSPLVLARCCCAPCCGHAQGYPLICCAADCDILTSSALLLRHRFSCRCVLLYSSV